MRSYELIARVFNGQSEGLTRDDILDNITITWLTNTAVSGARLYWEYWGKGFFNAKGVSIPVAVSVFPDELYPAPRSWTERAYPKLSITTSSTKADTLRPGNSRRSSQKRFAPASDRCASSGVVDVARCFVADGRPRRRRRDRLRGEAQLEASALPGARLLGVEPGGKLLRQLGGRYVLAAACVLARPQG